MKLRMFKSRGGRGGVRPYMGYIGMCGLKGYRFSAVLVINRVSMHTSLQFDFFLAEATFHLAFLLPSALCLPLRRLTPATQAR